MLAARIASLFASALLFTASLHAQTTWIVDDDGGTGVDFTTLTAAVSAASAGDRIHVYTGIYSGDVTITKGLRISKVGGGADPRIVGRLQVRDVPRSEEFRLTGLQANRLLIESCRGPVIASDATVLYAFAQAAGVRVLGCSNVRFTDCSFTGSAADHALRVHSSRVEVTSTTIRGAQGSWSIGYGRGGDAMRVEGRAIVSVNHCLILGGHGAAGTFGGDGGDGLFVEEDSRVHMRSDGVVSVTGGDGANGAPLSGENDGFAGSGVINYGWVERSDYQFYPGYQNQIEEGGIGYWGAGVLVEPETPFRLLETNTIPSSTASIPLVVHGQPGEVVSLLIGDRVQTNTTIGFDSPLLVDIDDVDFIGTIPENGELTYTYDAPAGWVPGDLVALQAMVLTAEGYRLSNSAAVVLR